MNRRSDDTTLANARRPVAVRRSVPILAAVAVMWLTATVTCGADIGFVVDPDVVVDGPFDMFWVERLESQGHTVTTLGADYDPQDPALSDIDLFLISNDVNSGDINTPLGGIAPDVEFFGVEGQAWFGGADLDGGFAGGPPRLFNLEPVDLTGHSNVELTVSVAARMTGWDEGVDFVSFNVDMNGDGTYETQLADFQPNFDGNLEELDAEMVLSEDFQDLTIPIGANVSTLRFQIDAYSTATGEQFGFDNIRITADGQTIASENLEGTPEQIGYTALGQGGTGNAFWDRVTLDQDGAYSRLDDPRPIITYEADLYDELQLSAAGPRSDEMLLEIDEPDHPLAAGLSGEVEIYEDLQGITQLGDPQAPDLEVVASTLGVPAIAVLEAGAEGLDGTPSPGQRIAIFAHDVGSGDLYTEAGLALLDAAVEYALSSTVTTPGDYNSNGELDAEDLDLQAAAIVGGQHPPEFDLNKDALVNFDSTLR